MGTVLKAEFVLWLSLYLHQWVQPSVVVFVLLAFGHWVHGTPRTVAHWLAVHEISQAGKGSVSSFPFSGDLSDPGIRHGLLIADRFFTNEPPFGSCQITFSCTKERKKIVELTFINSFSFLANSMYYSVFSCFPLFSCLYCYSFPSILTSWPF